MSKGFGYFPIVDQTPEFQSIHYSFVHIFILPQEPKKPNFSSDESKRQKIQQYLSLWGYIATTRHLRRSVQVVFQPGLDASTRPQKASSFFWYFSQTHLKLRIPVHFTALVIGNLASQIASPLWLPPSRNCASRKADMHLQVAS